MVFIGELARIAYHYVYVFVSLVAIKILDKM